MRRLLALVLLLAFGLPTATPLLALSNDPEAGLPVCCRSHGQHHCTMHWGGNRLTGDAVAAVAPPCALFPHAVTVLHLPLALGRAAASAVAMVAQPAVERRESRDLSVLDSAFPPQRGPPSLILL